MHDVAQWEVYGIPWPPVPYEDQGPSFWLMAAVVFHPLSILLLLGYPATQGLLTLG